MAMIFPLSLKPSQEEICIVRPVQLFSKSSPFHSNALIFLVPVPYVFAYKKWYLWTEPKKGTFDYQRRQQNQILHIQKLGYEEFCI